MKIYPVHHSVFIVLLFNRAKWKTLHIITLLLYNHTQDWLRWRPNRQRRTLWRRRTGRIRQILNIEIRIWFFNWGSTMTIIGTHTHSFKKTWIWEGVEGSQISRVRQLIQERFSTEVTYPAKMKNLKIFQRRHLY